MNLTNLTKTKTIQSLWSGYGEIYKAKTKEGKPVVVKQIEYTNSSNHPRGWNTDLGHQRKVKSYEVEMSWYSSLAKLTTNNCRIPECYKIKNEQKSKILVLEDLDAAGFAVRKSSLSVEQSKVCLKWLANFHATYLWGEPKGLWQIGTYWYLDTRPEELKIMDDDKLRKAAPIIDAKLNDCKYKTIVHGDAKLANFCFSKDLTKVAAVDFQYVGGGCGMKDVVYFLGSCLSEQNCEAYETELLKFYFFELQLAVNSEVNFLELENEWRGLYKYAWTDFYRFLKGWSPSHWKINSYSERLCNEVLEELLI